MYMENIGETSAELYGLRERNAREPHGEVELGIREKLARRHAVHQGGGGQRRKPCSTSRALERVLAQVDGKAAAPTLCVVLSGSW